MRNATRRYFLHSLMAGGAFWLTRGAYAQALTLTPSLTLGPYYPDRMPLDLDNDLILINDAITPAIGTPTWVSGRVLSRTGSPVRGALVEIWQADHNGAYIHSASPIANRDGNFQGYGKFLTGSDGKYLFRTVKPGLYPGRTRHIHYAVTIPGEQRFTTQLFINGDPLNASDGILNGVRDAAQRANIVPDWTPVPGSALGELAVRFDIVMGWTPTDQSNPSRPTVVYFSGNHSYTGITSAANHVPGVASGSWVSIYGAALSNTTRGWEARDFNNNALPTALDGVSVQIDGKPAAVAYVSPTQLNVLAPAVENASSASVTVNSASTSSQAVNIPLRRAQPAFFTMGDEYVAAIRADGSLVTAAKPGEIIVVYGTGFGPTNAAGELLDRARLWLDTNELNLLFAGVVSPGLYQFNFAVPANLRTGDYCLSASAGTVRTEKLARLRVTT